MTLERLYPRVTLFNANAEALAELALRYPVANARSLKLQENYVPNKHVKSGARSSLWLEERQLYGFTKLVTLAEAAPQILAGTLATLLGAPSSPAILLTDCPPQPHVKTLNLFRRSNRTSWRARHLRLFSAPATDDYTSGREMFDDDASWQRGEPMSLGLLTQFRLWLSDPDGDAWLNVARDDKSGQVWSFDHDCIGLNSEWQQATARSLEAASTRLLRATYKPLDVDGRAAFRAGAALMASRIAHCPPAALHDIGAVLKAARLPSQDKTIQLLVLRRKMFTRGAILPKAPS